MSHDQPPEAPKTPSDAVLNAAGAQLAKCMMRLCEALEMADAEHYPTTRTTTQTQTRREKRLDNLDHYYKRWFANASTPRGSGGE